MGHPSADQNPQLQLDALEEAGATRIFTDHGVSGSTANRPQVDACLDHIRECDVVTVWKLDRLGRNTQHVLAVVDQLTSRGIGFRSLTEGLHTDGPMGKAMLTIMAAFAQLERDTMIERTRAGLAAAAANGRKGGRPRKVDDAAAKARQLRQKGITATDIAKMLDVPRHRVLLPRRGRRSLELAEPQPLLNADQAAPGPTDDGQWGDPHHLRDARQSVARLPRRHVGDVRQAHDQYEPPAVAGLGVTARTPAAWPSGLVVLAVAARLLVPRLAVDEHEPAAVALPSARRWANLWLA
jgi:DNA invertase Pin-like site-specific DNA recombinase